MCVFIGWIGEWLQFPGSLNKTKVWCVCFGVLCVFTLLLNNTTSLITVWSVKVSNTAHGMDQFSAHIP